LSGEAGFRPQRTWDGLFVGSKDWHGLAPNFAIPLRNTGSLAMSNPVKYIKDLEAVGFARQQAEAQVQMVLDAIQGDFVTKGDLAIFKSELSADLVSKMDQRFAELMNKLEQRFGAIDRRFTSLDERFMKIDHRFDQLELRILVKLGFLVISSLTIAVGILNWMIKLH
jgi:hypothetical protein